MTPIGESVDRWTVQVDDLVGGWVVTSYPHPLSQHDFRPDGDPERRGYIFAECMSEKMAERLAGLLNAYGPLPSRMVPTYWPTAPIARTDGSQP